MADIDDFEIINETSLSNEQTFEVIDVNGVTEEKINTNTPTTPDIVLPLLIPKPVVDETSQVVQQQTPTPIVNSPEPKESHSPVKTTIPVTPFVPIKRTIQSPPPPIIFAPVPPLPKAPPLPRYGGAASIPHNLDASFNIDTIIDKSRKAQQTTLNISAQQQQKDIDIIIDKSRKAQQTTLNISTQQQQKDIQTILEQLASGSAFSNVLKAKEDLQKSPEQLEQEKRSILAQRVPPLQLDGKTKEDLIEMAKQFHHLLQQLHGAIYELSERFERQKYDMVELSERARQIEKGKAKTRKSNIVHTGLGGGIFAGVNDITAKAPAKVSLFSRYERVTDRRTFKDRRDVWAVEKKSQEFVAERPKAKIKQIAQQTEDSASRKTKRVSSTRQKSEDKPHEELPPPPAEEEEQAAAEEPAEEESAPAEQNEEAAEEEEE